MRPVARAHTSLPVTDMTAHSIPLSSRAGALRPFLLLLLFLVLPSAPVAAQEPGGIRGQVLDQDGVPVTEARIRLLPSGRTARVDDEGRFTFTAVNPGRHLLEVEAPRGGQALERVTVETGEIIELTVRLSPLHHLEELVVTAGAPARRDEVYQPTSVLTGRDLDARAEATLGETLRREPGVNSTYFGPGASRPVIRGLGGDRVRVLESGIGAGDASATSPDHAVSVEPMGAERIEIVRGPATLLYGSSAIGGVVNVLDDRISRTLPDDRVDGTLVLAGGTVADERTASADGSLRLGSFVANLSGSFRDTDDFEIPGVAERDPEPGEEVASGVLPNSSLESTRLAAGLSWVGERGFFGVAVSGFDTEYGIPGGHHGEEEHEEGEEEHEEEEEEEQVRVDLEQRRVDLEGDLRVDGDVLSGIRVRAGRADYEHLELENGEVGTVFLNEEWEGRVEARHRIAGLTDGSFGFQLRRRDFEAIGEEAFVPPTRTDNWAIFLFEEFGVDEIRFQLGTRLEVQSVGVRPEGAERDFQGVSVSGGLNWNPLESVGVTLSLSRSEKVPSAEELFSDGPHLATGTFERGDPELSEEVALSGDLTLRYRGERIRAEMTGFATSFDGFIFQSFTGDVEDGLPVVVSSQGNALHVGAEWMAEWEFLHLGSDHASLETFGDWVRAELAATDEPLPRIPPLRAGLGVSWDGGAWGARVEALRVTDQDRTAPFEEPTSGYTMLDASASYEIFHRGFVHDFVLQGTNLTDEMARNHLSFLKDVAPLPGRNIKLMYRLSF